MTSDARAHYWVTGAFVAMWIGLGLAFPLGSNAYLLEGVPLLLLFQTVVARRPLIEVWFADGGRLRMPGWGWMIAAAFMAWPIVTIIADHGRHWDQTLWCLCACGGAIPLAASFPRLTRPKLVDLGMCLITAGGASIGLMVLGLAVAHGSAPAHPATAAGRVVIFTRSLLLYLPVCFILEEVMFRGALDSYLRRVDASSQSGLWIGALWGLWHLPIIGAKLSGADALRAIVAIVVMHAIIGRFLSQYWRQSGLLLVPAFSHALVDAVRNALPHP